MRADRADPQAVRNLFIAPALCSLEHVSLRNGRLDVRRLRMGLAAGLAATVAVCAPALVSSPVLAQYDGYRYRYHEPDDDYARPRRRDDSYEERGYRGGYEDRRRRSSDEDYRPHRRDDRSYDDRQPDRRLSPDRSYDQIPSGPAAPQARGSFVQTCSDIQQNGFYLEARCGRGDGGFSRSRIDVRSCRSIANRNGQLACE